MWEGGLETAPVNEALYFRVPPFMFFLLFFRFRFTNGSVMNQGTVVILSTVRLPLFCLLGQKIFKALFPLSQE